MLRSRRLVQYIDRRDEKFVSLGLLKTSQFQIVADHAGYPVVGVLNRRPTEAAAVESLFRKCNVVVTTMALAGQQLGTFNRRWFCTAD